MNHSARLQLKTLPRRAFARAFTLIEILIVIALTAVLLGLLITPLVSALRYTQQAQIVTAAQDAARTTRERITRELGSAIFVFDGTSLPFQTTNTIVAGDDRYTNFLDLQILDANGNPAIAHAYSAKLDFVLPRLNSTGAAVDPTTGEPISYSPSQNGSALIGNPSYIFPLAAGTSEIRYWTGLKDPTKPYNNTREGKSVGSDDNTYILYRAQFLPYIKDLITGKTVPNTALFATRPKLDANGQPVKDANGNTIYIPELDDPDFFRYVGTGDVNWLNDTHANYTAAEVTAHNNRVDKWVQIAKPVIPGPHVDLLLLPHNADNTLAYDTTGGAFPGVAHSGVAHDPVSGTPGKSYPIVNTSVTFRPATVSGDATPGTTSDYAGQGVTATDPSGATYIPTVYTATSQSWSLPYHVSLYPSTSAATGMYYDTDQFASGTTPVAPTASNLSLNPGDIIEYRTDSTGRNPVYDVTQGFPFTQSGMTYTLGGNQFVPMTINPDSGTLMFAAPSLPKGPGDRYTRQWVYAAPNTNNPNGAGIDLSSGIVDLTQPGFTDTSLATTNPNASPLTNAARATNTTSTVVVGVDNAHLIPGSVRVFGPDQTPGPNSGQVISYTEVNSAVGAVSDNQYSVNPADNTLQLLPGAAGPVSVIYDYQANMTLTTPLPVPPGPALPVNLQVNPYLPMQVKVSYQTRDLIDVNIGVRIYNITTNRAEVIPSETKIKIGNSNR